MNFDLLRDEEFIKSLRKVVEAKLEDEHFGVKELAQATGMSRSQIHRRLKFNTNQSASQFIREIRLEAAKGLLQKRDFTISEIAFKVGFGSSSYFIKCFHEYVGYPPGEFIKYAPETALESRAKSGHRITAKKSFLGILAIAALVSSFFLIYGYFGKSDAEICIAVFPLKNLSDDVSHQHLADGITDDILNRLSYVGNLEVKSRISAERFRDGRTPTREIVKELGITHFLEGSILPDNDTIRISMQLIDAKTDNHIWAENYDRDFSSIIPFVSSIASEVVDALKIILSPSEKEHIEKPYTHFHQAYFLYQKGKYFFHRRTKEDLYKSIDYFNKALDIDSSYALAYAGLAAVYNELTRRKLYPWDEGYTETLRCAKKALSIDNRIDIAHVVIAHASGWHHWDWRTMEEELNIALKINSNCAFAYNYYSVYLMRMGDHAKAREFKNKALSLNPYDAQWFVSSAGLYYREERFDEVIKENQRALELNPRYKFAFLLNFRAYVHLGEYGKAIENLKKYAKLDTPRKNHDPEIDNVFSESGIDGVLQWLIDSRVIPRESRPYESDSINQYSKALYYCLLGNKEAAMVSLEQEFDMGHSVNLPKINNHPDFRILTEDARFIALLQKMNLPVK